MDNTYIIFKRQMLLRSNHSDAMRQYAAYTAVRVHSEVPRQDPACGACGSRWLRDRKQMWFDFHQFKRVGRSCKIWRSRYITTVKSVTCLSEKFGTSPWSNNLIKHGMLVDILPLNIPNPLNLGHPTASGRQGPDIRRSGGLEGLLGALWRLPRWF